MPYNSQLYQAARPDLLNNWQAAHAPDANPNDPNVAFIRQFPTMEAYLQNDYANDPNAEAQQAAGQYIAPPAGGGNDINKTVNGGTSGGFSALVPSGNQTSTTPTAQAPTATTPAVDTSYTPTTSSGGVGGNFNQTQAGSQVGTFQTNGATNTAQSQITGSDQLQNSATTALSKENTSQNQNTNQATTSGSNTTSNNTGSTNDISNTVQNVDQNTATTGTNTTQALDSLGFGQLLKDSAGSAQANDATRNNFLTDVVNTGGSQLASQLDQSIRNAGTGSTLVGAGDSANARARAYAAAQTGRNNLDERLTAAGQLAGPTALSTLSTSANPYIGSENTINQNAHTTGTTTGTTATTGTNSSTGNSSTNGFSNLVGNTNTTGSSTKADNTATSSDTKNAGFSNLLGSTNESQSGTATGQSSQSASGQLPQAQQVQTGGGCVLCTAATELGFFRNLRVLRRVISYKLTSPSRSAFSHASRGYFFLFTPLAAWLLTKPRLARVLYPLARMVVYEELRVSGRRLPFRAGAWTVHWAGHFLCAATSLILPLPLGVKNFHIEKIARKHHIWFDLNPL